VEPSAIARDLAAPMCWATSTTALFDRVSPTAFDVHLERVVDPGSVGLKRRVEREPMTWTILP